MGEFDDFDKPTAVPAGAAPDDAPRTLPPPVFAPPAGEPQTIVEVDAERAKPPPRRSRGALVAAIVGVVALLAAGAFAIVKITDDDEGGAASPADVGTELIAALEEEDLLGVVDLLLPSERDTLRQPVIDLVDDLKRLEVLAPEASLEDVGGLDLTFAGVEVDEQPTNVDDITNIVLSGTGSALVDGAEVPIGDFLVDEVFNGERPDMDQPPGSNEFQDVRLTTVERDGRWYLSAFYSAAEAARGEDQEIPTAGLAADGADEPEQAVDEMLRALIATDVTKMIALLDPTEAEALHRYAPLFLGDVEESVDDVPVEATISDVKYSVTGEGERRSVGIDSISVTLTAPEDDDAGPITMTYADGCLVVSGIAEESAEVCGTQFDSVDELVEDNGFGDSETTKELLDAVSAAFADFEPSGIAVHQVDGSWYVSPMRSFFDAEDSVMNALERAEIERIVEAFNGFMENMFSTDCASTDDEGCGSTEELSDSDG